MKILQLTRLDNPDKVYVACDKIVSFGKNDERRSETIVDCVGGMSLIVKETPADILTLIKRGYGIADDGDGNRGTTGDQDRR